MAQRSSPDPDIVAVYIEPSPGVSDEQLQNAMKAAKVTDVSSLVPGMFSARMPASNIEALKSVADVEVMQRKLPR
ncbi:hypothetical protein [Bradyrhizobium diversitatis]|uniref:Uncharacterized protein n=1 Tax=Bradyrhizobium diversitatis TaxID=2755406 RepID=A0ABS0NY13_9BRAD|nr:hypothetical protein [Bradyrhizobium diversitatis]MBH5385896.1 hypothetical protein [Bradyrhizobium diversitatis]